MDKLFCQKCDNMLVTRIEIVDAKGPDGVSVDSDNESDTEGEVEVSLKQIVKLFEESYKGKTQIDTSALPDIEDVKEAIQSICEENNIDRVYFFFGYMFFFDTMFQ